MFHIVRKSRERLITEGFERQLAERERLLQVLVEQVEYLRAQLQMPTRTVSMAAGSAPELDFSDLRNDVPLEVMEPLSEDEEQLQAMRQAGVLSQVEYDQALENLNRADPANIIE